MEHSSRCSDQHVSPPPNPTCWGSYVSSVDPSAQKQADSGEFVNEVLRWGAESRRDLPWRQTRDPWRVLVSELMLQQTQVARVIPKYEAFLDVFPNVVDCASGSAADVVKLWAGLGYNRRAINLHRCAVQIVSDHGGAVPSTLEELLNLSGIGPYTARAVLAFAFEIDVAVVDTNVARILARQSATTFSAKGVQAQADQLAPVGESWAWNQSMLDLGAMVCTKRSPSCGSCPVSQTCRWRGDGPDPASGSAGVGVKQSTFAGSDRQGRGRLVDRLRTSSVLAVELAEVMGWPTDPERAQQVANGLLADGLAVEDAGVFRLPS